MPARRTAPQPFRLDSRPTASPPRAMLEADAAELGPRMIVRPWICFVVPCFNEEDNVAPTVQSIRAAMGSERPFEIVLVDDCSTDRTLQRMQDLAEADARIRVLHNPVNLSLGGAYKRGVAVAQAEHVMMIPGDDGFPTESIAEIMRHAGEADIIIPVAINSGARSWFRAAAARGCTPLATWQV